MKLEMSCHAPGTDHSPAGWVLVINARISIEKSSNITSQAQATSHWLLMETIDPLKQGTYILKLPWLETFLCFCLLECYLAPRRASSEKQEMSEIHLRQSVFPWCLQRLPQETQGKLMRVKFVSWPLIDVYVNCSRHHHTITFIPSRSYLNCLY